MLPTATDKDQKQKCAKALQLNATEGCVCFFFLYTGGQVQQQQRYTLNKTRGQ
jgi:hypothetical protein